MTRKYTTEAVVQGASQFPLDMLRYDCCFPATSIDAASIGYDDEQKRTVTLRQYSELKDGQWTKERWESFGWKVVSLKRVT